MAKVSICIPAYKQPEFLRKTLESVVAQDYRDYETIVTDDSPDDSVAELVSDFAQLAKIRYFRNIEKKGSPENWNEAVRHASGEYIKILHHDDWFAGSDSLGRFVLMLDENPQADFAFSATIVSSTKTERTRVNTTSDAKLKKLQDDPRYLYFGNIVGAPSATIYRRNPALEYDVKLQWLVDIDFYISLLSQNSCHVYCQKPLICTTDEAPHQVTEECIGNKNLQLFEYIHLYNKIFPRKSFNMKLFRLFWKLMGRFNVNSLDEIYAAGITSPVPALVEQVIATRKLFRCLSRSDVSGG